MSKVYGHYFINVTQEFNVALEKKFTQTYQAMPGPDTARKMNTANFIRALIELGLERLTPKTIAQQVAKHGMIRGRPRGTKMVDGKAVLPNS